MIKISLPGLLSGQKWAVWYNNLSQGWLEEEQGMCKGIGVVGKARKRGGGGIACVRGSRGSQTQAPMRPPGHNGT